MARTLPARRSTRGVGLGHTRVAVEAYEPFPEAAPRSVAMRVEQDAMEPHRELLRVAQGRELLTGLEQGFLEQVVAIPRVRLQPTRGLARAIVDRREQLDQSSAGGLVHDQGSLGRSLLRLP
jgi:hypothetical protein